jgi:hypothetical protein
MSSQEPAPRATLDLERAAIRFEEAMEHLDEHEAETTAHLIETITKIRGKVYEDSGHAHRGVHAKSHGVLVGNFELYDSLPPILAQGLFAKQAVYPVVMRFSTIPGDLLDDNVSVPRAVAIKVVGVPGARVDGSEADCTQDFVLANGPVFAKGHPKAFLSSLKLLAGTTDRVPGLKKVLSSVMRGAERLVEARGGQSPTMMSLGGYPEVNILGEEFYSQAPILYGDCIAKVALKPLSTGLRALRNTPVDLKGKPDGLREAVVEFFRANGGEWEFQVQLCTDIDSMPIEDAAKQWPEGQSPYLPVARITMPAQDAWSVERVELVDEGMAFSPWHALAAHRPLGAIMRVRKSVYEAAAQFRATHNHGRIKEPRSIADLPH